MQTVEKKLPDAFYDARLLSVKETREFLGVSRNMIYRLMKNRRDPLPSVKIGKSRKFPLDKLLWWKDNREE